MKRKKGLLITLILTLGSQKRKVNQKRKETEIK